jgi:hypothetical protein
MNDPSASGLHYYLPPSQKLNRTLDCDLCIYGGSSGGIAAAIVARRLGLKPIVLEPSRHLGGMTAGGLGLTDIGNKQAIGGVSREFYRRLGTHYGTAEHWRFEPHVAEEAFQTWLREEKVEVFLGSFLARAEMRDNRLTRIWTENGLEVSARMFLDCSYEGDLMAAAHVSHTVGRESNEQYGETLNGAQVFDKHQFKLPVDPYRTEGDAGSGLLPGIEPGAPVVGREDRRVQAYNFRLCLCKDPPNQLPITQPADYDRSRYELLARYIRAGYVPEFDKFDQLVRGKVDLNNHGAVSTDYIGQNHDFPQASYARREEIFQEHVSYIKGLLWFWKQDTCVPAEFQQPFQDWGWAKDEFVDCGGFSHAIYVREGRRLVGDVVITEHHCTGAETVEDSAGLAAYTMDSHNCRRFARDGRVWNEGDVQAPAGPPYPIAYRAMVPKRGECENLLIPFCLSASHIAFGSIRMEPVFMILAESCVHAASLALRGNATVQDVPYEDLRSQLLLAGQVLDPVAKARDSQAGE